MRRRFLSFSLATFATHHCSEALLSSSSSYLVAATTRTSSARLLIQRKTSALSYSARLSRAFFLTTAVPYLSLPQLIQSQSFSTTSCKASTTPNSATTATNNNNNNDDDDQTRMNSSSSSTTCENNNNNNEVDPEYPGTAVQRLKNVHLRVATLTEEDLSGDWVDVRRKILWAGGLKDLPDSIPGQVSTLNTLDTYDIISYVLKNVLIKIQNHVKKLFVL